MRSPPLILAAVALALPCWADVAPSPNWMGDTLQTDGKCEVIMEEEEVLLTLSGYDSSTEIPTPVALDVVARFHMRNPTDKPITIEVGFPFNHKFDAGTFRVDREEGAPPLDSPPKYCRAEGDDPGKDGEPEPPPVHPGWMLWTATYPPGKTLTETVRYRIQTKRNEDDWDRDMGSLLAEYVLDSGAGWAEPIGKAVIELRFEKGLSADHLRELWPEGYVRKGESILWRWERLEPTHLNNIRIRFNPTWGLRWELHLELFSRVEKQLKVLPLNTLDRGKFWQDANRYLDDLPIGPALEERLSGPICFKAYPAELCLDLLHEAVSHPDEEGARKALPLLRDVGRAFQDGRILLGKGDPMTSKFFGLPPERLSEDLKRADALLSGK